MHSIVRFRDEIHYLIILSIGEPRRTKSALETRPGQNAWAGRALPSGYLLYGTRHEFVSRFLFLFVKFITVIFCISQVPDQLDQNGLNFRIYIRDSKSASLMNNWLITLKHVEEKERTFWKKQNKEKIF